MKYKELLKNYKEGTLTENDRIQVEAELEKYNAISEYLFDNTELNLDDISVPELEIPDNDEMTNAIEKEIRRTFIKAGIITAAVAVIISILAFTALPKLVSNFYYNPNKTVYEDVESGKSVNQMSKDLSIYAEARIPELGTNISVGSDAQGYGKYYVYVSSWFDTKGKTVKKGFAGLIKRNESMWYEPEELEYDSANPGTFTSDNKVNVKNLGNRESYYTYVSLKKPLSYEQVLGMYNEMRPSGSVWCAVKTSEEIEGNTGFFLTDDGQGIIEYDSSDEYPNLKLQTAEGEDGYVATEDIATEHFISMLRYLEDNELVLSIMEWPAYPEFYKESAEYVEKNGLQIYGLYMVVDANKIKELENNEYVKGVNVENL